MAEFIYGAGLYKMSLEHLVGREAKEAMKDRVMTKKFRSQHNGFLLSKVGTI